MGMRLVVASDSLVLPLSADGMACVDCNRTAIGQNANRGLALAGGWRRVLYVWRSLFRYRFATPFWPPDLASVCHRWYRLPLCCGSLVCGVTFAELLST